MTFNSVMCVGIETGRAHWYSHVLLSPNSLPNHIFVFDLMWWWWFLLRKPLPPRIDNHWSWRLGVIPKSLIREPGFVWIICICFHCFNMLCRDWVNWCCSFFCVFSNCQPIRTEAMWDILFVCLFVLQFERRNMIYKEEQRKLRAASRNGEQATPSLVTTNPPPS